VKHSYSLNSTEIRITSKVKFLHPAVETIVNNPSEIDVIRNIRISPDLLKASSETSGGQQKHPVTNPDHPTAIGVALILDIEHKEIQFFEMNSATKGYGEKMVQAVLNGLQEDWRVIVMMTGVTASGTG